MATSKSPAKSSTSSDAVGKLERPHTTQEIVISDINTECPYIDVAIGTNQFRTLVDTGSQLSIIDETFLDLCDQKLIRPIQNEQHITLKSVSGHHLKVIKQVQLRVTLGKVRMYHPFIVVQGLGKDMILGMDFLTLRKAHLDFDHKTLTIGKAVFPLKEKTDTNPSTVHLVRLSETVHVHPRSDVQIKCSVTKRKSPGEQFEVTQLPSSPCFENEPGLLLPNALVKVSKNKHIPWIIVNETGRFVTFKKGQVLGTAVSYTEQKEVDISAIDSKEPEHSTVEEKLAAFRLDHVPEPEKSQLQEALTQNLDVFVLKDKELTVTNAMEISIDTQNHPPIKQKPYRLPLAHRALMDDHIKEMLDAGIIKRSNSPWLSPVIIVPKKDGSKRVCIDFRKINAVTIMPAPSIPSTEDIFYSLGKSKFRSCLDLKSGFWQVPIREEDKEKTAFSTGDQLFQMEVMPFGLCSAPSYFQNLMNKVLGDVRQFALAFIDDIIVFSNTFEEHLEHLEIVFDRLRKANLKLKISKCDFLRENLNYLGHVISNEGISVDPEKVKVVEGMRAPATVREVRSYLGMTSYYRKYVPEFSKIARPLTALTRKHAKFKWTKEAQEAFETLKQCLVKAPILAFPDISAPFQLYTDASQYALGAVLMQEIEGEKKVIQYVSHQFTVAQQKWPTIEREAFAIIYSLQKLRPIVLGTQLTVFTDHKPLKHLFTSEMKNPRIQRWAIMLGEFGCNIEYISGPKNVTADTLSRLHNTAIAKDLPDNEHMDWKGELHAVDITTVHDTQQSQDKSQIDFQHFDPTTLPELQRSDEELKVIIEALDANNPAGNTQFDKYCLQDGILYHVSAGTKTRPHTRLQLVLPQVCRKLVLQQLHDGYFGGHLGIEKTTDKIQKSYFWPNMLKEIKNYVLTCEICNCKKLRKERRPLMEMPMPRYPMDIVGIDTCGPYPISSLGNQYVCTIVDHFSGWPEAFAIPNKAANTIAKLLLEEFIPRHGCPRLIISDQGTEYCNAVIDTVTAELGIARIHTSSYHACSNGKVERFHKVMNEMIAKKISEDQELWDTVLDSCLAAYRTSKQESTNYSPFFIMYGRDPILGVDGILKIREQYQGEDYVPIMFERLHEAYQQVIQNLEESRERNSDMVAKKAQKSSFIPGDAVYYFDPTVKPGNSSKLTIHWQPNWRILDKKSDENYLIKNMANGKTKIVHSENLRRRDTNDVWKRQFDKVSPPVRIPTHIREESEPLRQQPLRAARLPFSDRHWYQQRAEQQQNVPSDTYRDPELTSKGETLFTPLTDGEKPFRPTLPRPTHRYNLRSRTIGSPVPVPELPQEYNKPVPVLSQASSEPIPRVTKRPASPVESGVDKRQRTQTEIQCPMDMDIAHVDGTSCVPLDCQDDDIPPTWVSVVFRNAALLILDALPYVYIK